MGVRVGDAQVDVSLIDRGRVGVCIRVGVVVRVTVAVAVAGTNGCARGG